MRRNMERMTAQSSLLYLQMPAGVLWTCKHADGWRTLELAGAGVAVAQAGPINTHSATITRIGRIYMYA